MKKDSARLNSYAQMRAEVVDLLRAEAALHMTMDVDGACMTGSKGKGKTKGKGRTDDPEGKGKANGKGMKGKETRVCYKCNKPGHLRKDCTVYKKRIAEKGNKEKVETPAAVKGATVETWEYTEDDYVFAFGEAVIAAVQRPETHICIDSGAFRSACPSGYAPDVSAKGTAPPLFSIDGPPIEQRGYKKVHWQKRDSAGEMKSVSTMVESSVFLVASVSRLEENGTSVVFSCSSDYYLIRQPMSPPWQSQGVSHVKLQKHNGTYWLQADRRVTVDDKSSANTLAGFSSVQMAPVELPRRQTWMRQTRYRILQRLEESHKRPGTPTQRQRDVHELTHIPPIPWCPACVSGKAADDPDRRRQDGRDFGLDVASFDHYDSPTEVGMFNKKLKFKVFCESQEWSSCSFGKTERRH